MVTETPVLDKDKILEQLLTDLDRLPPGGPPEDGREGDPFPSREPEWRPFIDNARLAMLIFLGAEAMFFAALVGAFLVLRLGAQVWPPPFQPRLPVGVTGVNTLVLFASILPLTRALRAIRRGDQGGLVAGLGQTALLGLFFLAVQGYEWARLLGFGLTASSGAYGATFYTLIGAHALHLLAALIWLSIVVLVARRGRFTAQSHVGALLCGMYWYFVVSLWPVLYLLVYLR